LINLFVPSVRAFVSPVVRNTSIAGHLEEARAVAYDIEDRVVLDATVQLAQDLERFAARLAARLAEVDSIKPVSPTGTTR
jgi:hypothetical protein